MREFILRAQKARTGQFDVNDLPSAGHMEIVCQCIAQALWVSNHVREDTLIHVVLEGADNAPKVVSFDGGSIQGLRFDEKGIAEMVLDALKKGKHLKLGEGVLVSPGVSVSKKSFEQLIKEKASEGQLYYLHKKGTDVREEKFSEHPIFVFGDYTGIPTKTEKFLDSTGAKQISVGPVMLFAAQCIVLTHHELDRRIR